MTQLSIPFQACGVVGRWYGLVQTMYRSIFPMPSSAFCISDSSFTVMSMARNIVLKS